ncbi:ROK family protein, partial [Microbacterium sp. NRRL B-14842]|uniref:ROK family protein n=1 Tax=Microbacterium sp. NRRL B-14842 TaxID=3162881 RepID=UPI003D2B5ED0
CVAARWAEHELGGARPTTRGDPRDRHRIAGALLVGGHPYTAGGYAGEIGHSPIADGPVCPCGARGCLEAVASAGAIARRYREATGTTPDGAKDVIARAAAGDRVAADIWDSALDALTLSLAQLTAVVAPRPW